VQQNGVSAAAAGSKAALTERIEALLKSAPILLFMKVIPGTLPSLLSRRSLLHAAL
jgi:hypothetical protein